MMYWYSHGMGAWGPLVMFSMLALWAVLFGGVVLLSRRPHDTRPLPRPGTAEQLLAERYAQGQIDDDEYERRLRLLRSTRP